MKYYLSIFLLALGFAAGKYYGDYGLVTGSIIFKNLREKNGSTVSDVFFVGERRFLRRDLDKVYADWPLYDKEGNRLFRWIEADVSSERD
ncbi:MAG: hypothetical protein EOP09_18120 [Proteobacteria bacterium]|nr:MAG: hypothetical protein EOP09_18120 [Pseudomonadota bacterium]